VYIHFGGVMALCYVVLGQTPILTLEGRGSGVLDEEDFQEEEGL
jgi:hypothetical protein